MHSLPCAAARFACVADAAPGRAWQVYKEITYQVRRLDHHASLAIWGGNNEIEVAFGWFPESRDPDKARLYAADYNQVQAALRECSCGALGDAALVSSDYGESVHLCLNGDKVPVRSCLWTPCAGRSSRCTLLPTLWTLHPPTGSTAPTRTPSGAA